MNWLGGKRSRLYKEEEERHQKHFLKHEKRRRTQCAGIADTGFSLAVQLSLFNQSADVTPTKTLLPALRMGAACSKDESVNAVNPANGELEKSPAEAGADGAQDAPDLANAGGGEPVHNGDVPNSKPPEETPAPQSKRASLTVPDEPVQSPEPKQASPDDPKLDAVPESNAGITLSTGPKFKLVYFAGVRGRAEPLRLIFRCADVAYEEQLVQPEEWATMKADAPMGSLPLLHAEEEVLCQSNSIARYLAREFGLLPLEDWDKAVADQVVYQLNERKAALVPLYYAGPENYKVIWPEYLEEHVKPLLDELTAYLAAYDNAWFAGPEMSWADIVVFSCLESLQTSFDPQVLQNHESLAQFVDKIQHIQTVAAYLRTRLYSFM